jgi:hypothetical protein
MEPLTDIELERQKRSFISARENRLSILALSLVFTTTLIATWLASAALLMLGLRAMPLRYAVSVLVGYGAFFLAVRVWADYQRAHPADRSTSGEGWPIDTPVVDAEGCLIVLALFAVGVVIAGVLSWLGSAVMLEVAFEVVFAGILVRRMGKLDEVGQWAKVLLKRTWWLALLILIAVTSVAHHYQSKYPQATKVSDVWKMSKP